VLVVMPDGTPRGQTARNLYVQLVGFGFAADIIVATPGDLKKYGDYPGLIYKQALEEGREIYHAAL